MCPCHPAVVYPKPETEGFPYVLPVGGNSSHSPSELSLLLVSETSLWLAEATASQGSQPSENSLPTMLTFCLDQGPRFGLAFVVASLEKLVLHPPMDDAPCPSVLLNQELGKVR